VSLNFSLNLFLGRGDFLDPRGCAPLASLYPKVPLLTAERSEGADEAELAGPHQSFLPPFPIRLHQRFHVSDHAPMRQCCIASPHCTLKGEMGVA
jgi:hypothetical protein